MFCLTSRLPASLRLLGVTVVTIPYVPELRLSVSAVNSYPVKTVTAQASPEVSLLFCTEIKVCLPLHLSLWIPGVFFLPFLQHVLHVSGSLKAGRNQIPLLSLHLTVGIHSLLVRVMPTPPPRTAQSSPGAMM